MKRKNIKESLRNYFFVNPTTRLRVRQIERRLTLPLPSVIRYVRALKEEKILKETSIGNVVFYSADRSSERFLLEKRLFNIGQLHTTGLINHLKFKLHNPTIVVFGSYAKGEDTEKSDVDLYIETPSKKKLALEEFEEQLNRKIQVFVHKNLREIKSNELKNSIINGVTLNGFLKAFK